MSEPGGKRLLVVGRLLKEQGNGRREKLAEELRVFRANGFRIDCLTMNDATPDLQQTLSREWSDIVDDWFVLDDPVLEWFRTAIRKIKKSGHQADPARARLRPRMKPSHPLNFLLSLPDPLAGWYLFNKNRISTIIGDRAYSHIYSISSPHSFHLAGKFIKKKLSDSVWVMSFRDPWSNFPLLHPSAVITAFNKRLERTCLEHCDKAVIYKGWIPQGRDYFIHLYGQKLAEKIHQSPYIGCDEKRIDACLAESGKNQGSDCFNFCHLGTLYGNDHTPLPFLKALSVVLEIRPELASRIKVHFVGSITEDANDFLRQHQNVSEVVQVYPYLPFDEAIQILSGSQVALWFQAATGHFIDNVPAKVFEYNYIGLPILGISVAGNRHRVLEDLNIGNTCLADNIDSIADRILSHVDGVESVRSGEPDKAFPRSGFRNWFDAFVKSL